MTDQRLASVVAIGIVMAVGSGLTSGAIAASPAHVERLLKTNQCPMCDLSGANLADANLFGANLVNANLSGANLSGANLGSANLTDANLSGTNLTRSYLYQATLDRTNLSQANLSEAYLREAIIGETNFQGAKLTAIKWRGANLSGINLQGATLQGADLRDATFVGLPGRDQARLTNPAAVMFGLTSFNQLLCHQSLSAQSLASARDAGLNLAFANLQDANLQGAQLDGALLASVNLSRANLSNASLKGACLRGSKLNDAVLDGADLENAELRDAILQGASLKAVKNADLSTAYRSASEAELSPQQTNARQIVGSMNRAEQAYYLENERFAPSLSALQLGIQPDTEHYLFRVFAQGTGLQARGITAGIARTDGLRSYIGLVGLTQTSNRELTSMAVLCESEQPTKQLPPAKALSQLRLSAPCPPGYRRLER